MKRHTNVFVSKKKYDSMVAERETWKELTEKMTAVAENFQRNGNKWQDIAISCQEDNKRLVAHEEEMLAKMKELEQQRDMWRERAEEENRQAEIYRGILKSAEVG